ncbi:PHP domain-containing protein [Agromyces aerolatus]|uniref:PHP domain-containing protein n=1 Tax=Agromyces sp. LY-1074 TaxID=3074080 RepID=UPI002864086A|nr:MULTISPECIES: PHP domain-containing protein [unclassified Agromyces]MDR5699692.1 PHP domain-containing protein [Agromyces sp. LY-1074]MDR5705988.1 PHP domain-containing protein [Agromyces sp. LY-1358]
MDAAEALDEIASLLERELASSYKSKAYRRAANLVRDLSPDELAARIADGRLRRTAGIGDSTYRVIVDAAAGRVPDKLATLRAETGAAGAHRTGLAAELKGDLHSHSEWSDGTTSIQAMARGAAAVGLEWMVLSDHSPSLRVANGLSAERLTEQLEIVEALNTDGGLGVRILPGIEVDILEDGSLDQSPEMLERLDVVVASVHSKLRAPERDMTRRMLRAIADPHTNVLGHCTGRLVKGSRGTRPQSTFDAAAVFAACAEHDVAVEINSRPEREDPPDELIAQARDAGCLFSIDSDAHAPGHFAFLELGAARAERAGIPADRIVTTWDVDRLREWSRRTR